MVVVRDARTESEADDLLFRALADRTRRDIVARTMRAEHSVSALARAYPMSFAAVQKHVAVLERAGLVTKRRRGREQLVLGSVDAVHRAHGLLDQFEAMWRDRIDRFGAVLADHPEQGADR
jgi:DNA-binding transcriptional ArsR family regulator